MNYSLVRTVMGKYSYAAYFIMFYIVALDEIALDWDLDHYYTAQVVIPQ